MSVYSTLDSRMSCFRYSMGRFFCSSHSTICTTPRQKSPPSPFFVSIPRLSHFSIARHYLNRARPLPLLAGPTLPFLHDTYLTFFQSPGNIRSLPYTVTRTITIFSFAGHKEWLFCTPLYPPCTFSPHNRSSHYMVALVPVTSAATRDSA